MLQLEGLDLLVELQDFQNIFQILENPTLVQEVKYKIETTSNLPFKLIYNLSSQELAILQTYLETF